MAYSQMAHGHVDGWGLWTPPAKTNSDGSTYDYTGAWVPPPKARDMAAELDERLKKLGLKDKSAEEKDAEEKKVQEELKKRIATAVAKAKLKEAEENKVQEEFQKRISAVVAKTKAKESCSSDVAVSEEQFKAHLQSLSLAKKNAAPLAEEIGERDTESGFETASYHSEAEESEMSISTRRTYSSEYSPLSYSGTDLSSPAKEGITGAVGADAGCIRYMTPPGLAPPDVSLPKYFPEFLSTSPDAASTSDLLPNVQCVPPLLGEARVPETINAAPPGLDVSEGERFMRRIQRF